MDHCVFIHSNPKQIVGAIVAQHALRRNSRNADKFDVKIIDTRDHPFFAEYEGKTYLRDGVERVWLNDDLQSFTPLRFMPPELMGYQRPRGDHRSRHLRGGRHLGPAVARHAGQGDHRARTIRHEGAHRSLHGVERDAARLREADALAMRGAVPFDVRDEARLLRLDLPETRRPRHDRPARKRVERLRSPDREDEDAAHDAAQDAAVEIGVCRSTGARPNVSDCSRRSAG